MTRDLTSAPALPSSPRWWPAARRRRRRWRTPTWTASAPPTTRCTPSCTSTATARSRRPARVDARRAAGAPLGAAGRRAARAEGRVHHARRPHHVRLADPRGLDPAVRRHGHRAAARGRGGDPGQDQHGRVRHGLVDRELARTARRTTPGTLDRIPGGSSAARRPRSPLIRPRSAIGTDTGGSIRQPAAVTGIVGVKPTYGAVSRYGLVAFSSSLDQAGPFARTVLDAALLHDVDRRARPDGLPRRSTQPVPPVVAAARGELGGRARVCASASSSSFRARATSPACRRRFDEVVTLLADARRRGRQRRLPALRVRPAGVLPDRAE